MSYESPQRKTIQSYQHYKSIQAEDLVGVYRSYANTADEVPVPIDMAMEARAPELKQEIDNS